MSKRSDTLVFDEPVATGWLRTEIRGNQKLALSHIQDARRLLGALRSTYGVNDRIAAGEAGGFFFREVQLPDGTFVKVVTNNGVDTAQINAPSTSEARPENQVSVDAHVAPVPPSEEYEIPVDTDPEVLPSHDAADPLHLETSFDPKFPPEPVEKRATTKSTKKTKVSKREYCALGVTSMKFSDSYIVNGIGVQGPMIGADGKIIMALDLLIVPFEVFVGQTGPGEYRGRVAVFDPSSGAGLAQIGEVPYPQYAGLTDVQWFLNSTHLRYNMVYDLPTNLFYANYILSAHNNDNGFGPAGYGIVAIDSTGSMTETFTSSISDFGHPQISMRASNSRGTIALSERTAANGVPENEAVYAYDTATGGVSSVDQASSPPTTFNTKNGDLIIASPGGGSVLDLDDPTLIRVGPGARSYDSPQTAWVVGGEFGVGFQAPMIICRNDNETLYFAQYTAVGAEPNFKRYTPDGGWESITVPGGFGPRPLSPSFVDLNFGPNLFHDPISDAVAFVKPDGSGAWIFDATDCMGAPLGAFFFDFGAIPTEARRHPQQFYDGQILVRYLSEPVQYYETEFPQAGFQYFTYVRAGYFSIGELRQTKNTEYEECDEDGSNVRQISRGEYDAGDKETEEETS